MRKVEMQICNKLLQNLPQRSKCYIILTNKNTNRKEKDYETSIS